MKKTFVIFFGVLLGMICIGDAYADCRGIIKVMTKNGHTYEGEAFIDTNTGSEYEAMYVQYQGNKVDVKCDTVKSIKIIKRDSKYLLTLKNGRAFNVNYPGPIVLRLSIKHELGTMNVYSKNIDEIYFIDVK